MRRESFTKRLGRRARGADVLLHFCASLHSAQRILIHARDRRSALHDAHQRHSQSSEARTHVVTRAEKEADAEGSVPAAAQVHSQRLEPRLNMLFPGNTHGRPRRTLLPSEPSWARPCCLSELHVQMPCVPVPTHFSNPEEFQRALEGLRAFLLEFRAYKGGFRLKAKAKLRERGACEPPSQDGAAPSEEDGDESNAPLSEGTEVRYRLEMANYCKAVGNVKPPAGTYRPPLPLSPFAPCSPLSVSADA